MINMWSYDVDVQTWSKVYCFDRNRADWVQACSPNALAYMSKDGKTCVQTINTQLKEIVKS